MARLLDQGTTTRLLNRLGAGELFHVVELRFFDGLSHAEIARALGVSLPTIERRWRLARAWLRAELHR